jgi:hypothetical protein
MTLRSLVLFTVLLLAMPAWSQTPANRAASNANCFTAKEAEAESEVRAGIRLREILCRCATVDPVGKAALDDWYAFDRENSDRLKAAVETRQGALNRLTANSRLKAQNSTDALVATEKPLEANDAVCKSTYDMVERIKKDKWPGFKYYARLQQNLLPDEIPLCRR